MVFPESSESKLQGFKTKIYDSESLKNLNGYFYIATNFIEGLASSNGVFLVILDNNLKPVWSQKIPKQYQKVNDFKQHPNGVYSYWRGNKSRGIKSKGEFVILGVNKEIEKTIKIKNHEQTDPHELIINPNGNIMLLSYEKDDSLQQVNTIIQEQDRNENVIWEWNSKEHFSREVSCYLDIKNSAENRTYIEKIITGFQEINNYKDWSIKLFVLKYKLMKLANKIFTFFMPAKPETLDKPVYDDIVHGNSIFVCDDGNILLSCRHLNAVTKINYKTGNIIWTLGGEKSKVNQFSFYNDSQNGFSAQHKAHFLANGNLFLFDNGNMNNPQFSRAVEYKLDQTNKTAELVWEYKNLTEAGYTYGAACGSVQKMSNDLVLIGWGIAKSRSIQPAFSIVKGNQEKVADFFMPTIGEYTYRVHYADSKSK